MNSDAEYPLEFSKEKYVMLRRSVFDAMQTRIAALEQAEPYRKAVDEILTINFLGVAKGDPMAEIAAIVRHEIEQVANANATIDKPREATKDV